MKREYLNYRADPKKMLAALLKGFNHYGRCSHRDFDGNRCREAAVTRIAGEGLCDQHIDAERFS